MPRLSVIIPHLGDDVALENTILSVLENKSQDSEIIVVHDGSYRNPYHLQDELLLIQMNSDSTSGLLNAGLRAAKSPVVCVLCHGATVLDERWAEAPLRILQQERQLAAVAIQARSTRRGVLGISLEQLRVKPVYSRKELESIDFASVVAPLSSVGFYRRQTLLALGGWNEKVAWRNADIELAMLLRAMGLDCGHFTECDRIVSEQIIDFKSRSEIEQLAALAAGYGLRKSNLVTIGLDVLRGVRSGKPLTALAWAVGLRDSAVKQEIEKRCDQARDRLLSLQGVFSPIQASGSLTRRAA